MLSGSMAPRELGLAEKAPLTNGDAQVRRPLAYEPVSPKHANGGDDGILALRLAAVQESIQD